MTADRAAALLFEHFGITGTLTLLASERDTNFHVAADDCEYVFKIANSAEDAVVTDFQNQALLHLADADRDLPVPRVVRARTGDESVSVGAVDGRSHTARVLSWLQGTPLQHAINSAGAARSIGQTLARLDKALRGFEHNSSHYNLLWDLKRATHLRELVDNIEDAATRDICRSALDAFSNDIEPILPDLRWQVIHNDMNPSNVLVDAGSPATVSGVIDFGDMVRSPLIVDVAVACAYLVRDGFGDVEEFLAAYTSEWPLRDEEIAVLFGLIKLRKVMTVLIANWRATRYPENREYILRNERRARDTLGSMHALSPTAVTDRLRQACHRS